MCAADNSFLGLDFNKQIETFKATFGEKCLLKCIFIWFLVINGKYFYYWFHFKIIISFMFWLC